MRHLPAWKPKNLQYKLKRKTSFHLAAPTPNNSVIFLPSFRRSTETDAISVNKGESNLGITKHIFRRDKVGRCKGASWVAGCGGEAAWKLVFHRRAAVRRARSDHTLPRASPADTRELYLFIHSDNCVNNVTRATIQSDKTYKTTVFTVFVYYRHVITVFLD